MGYEVEGAGSAYSRARKADTTGDRRVRGLWGSKFRSDAYLDKLAARASDIRAISVSQGMLTPEGAKRLKEFPRCSCCFFNGSFIDDSVLEAISDHPNLRASVTQRLARR